MRGFSLGELLVAFGVVAVALILIIGVFTTALRSSQKSVDMTAGTIVADSVMEERLYGILADPVQKAALFSASAGAPYEQGNGANLKGVEYSYAIYAEPVLDAVPAGANRLLKVDVIVWWWKPDVASGGSVADSGLAREGYGLLRTELSRLVNENSGF